MKFATLTATHKRGTASFILSIRTGKKARREEFINYLTRISATGVKTDYFLAFPTTTFSLQESAKALAEFVKKEWGSENGRLCKETRRLINPHADRDDELVIVLRQAGADPEKGKPTTKDIVWWPVRNVEHFKDCLEFYSGAAEAFGTIKIIPDKGEDAIHGGEDYVIGTPEFRREHKLAERYEFLRIYPASNDWYPTKLRIPPPVD